MDMEALQLNGFQPVSPELEYGPVYSTEEEYQPDLQTENQPEASFQAVLTPIIIIETTHFIQPGNNQFPIFPNMGATSTHNQFWPYPNNIMISSPACHPLCPCGNQSVRIADFGPQSKCLSFGCNGNCMIPIGATFPAPSVTLNGQLIPAEVASQNILPIAVPPFPQHLSNQQQQFYQYQTTAWSGIFQPPI